MAEYYAEDCIEGECSLTDCTDCEELDEMDCSSEESYDSSFLDDVEYEQGVF